ncbi:MAG TPA: DNA helicase UvrD [Dehalococcoidia bacterium]|nr:DNA helicase UvrD [Dehalococcoidia bacterium]
MSFTADLHLHSRFAYACSKDLTLPNMASWAEMKGIDLLSTADFTHPAWLSELEGCLSQTPEGHLRYGGVSFVLGTEISCVFKQGGRPRRVHLLVFAPDFPTVHGINDMLTGLGAKLNGDGRPTVTVSARDLTARLLDISPQCMVVPAHIWTPWYGMLGSKSGFDALDECFQDMTPHIPAVETGLSSDPEMNWRVPALAGKAIVSFSDAHSLPNMGRELTVFAGEPGYRDLSAGLNENRVEKTIEFFPEEGKYHLNGHRKCGVSQSPEETDRSGSRCPECGRPMTLGVLHRVEELSEGEPVDEALRRPYDSLVPLVELLSLSLGRGRNTKTVVEAYRRICHQLGGEVRVLTRANREDLAQAGGDTLAEAVIKVRERQVEIAPGFDGQYGTVRPMIG